MSDRTTLDALQARARTIMDAHGLTHWQIRLDHARRRAGCCNYQDRTLSFSATLLPTYPPAAVDEVILHEVAHALVGPGHGHGPVWKRTAQSIGAAPKARLDGALPRPQSPWRGVCPRCGGARNLFRAPRRVAACGSCSPTFSPDLILQWTHLGVPTVPPGAYARELARFQ